MCNIHTYFVIINSENTDEVEAKVSVYSLVSNVLRPKNERFKVFNKECHVLSTRSFSSKYFLSLTIEKSSGNVF